MLLSFISFLFSILPSILTADTETIEIDINHSLLKYANLNKLYTFEINLHTGCSTFLFDLSTIPNADDYLHTAFSFNFNEGQLLSQSYSNGLMTFSLDYQFSLRRIRSFSNLQKFFIHRPRKYSLFNQSQISQLSLRHFQRVPLQQNSHYQSSTG